MKFAHIAPSEWVPHVAKYSQCHLTLAHLVESDPRYVRHFRQIQNNHHKTMIMDNSAFEMFKQGRQMFPSDKLISLGRKIDADYIVMSDYPNQHWKNTRDAAIDLADQFRAEKFGTFYVPQAEIGNLDGLLQSFEWAADSNLVDYIGVSILAVPNAFGVEKSNNLQRYLSRFHFMGILERQGILQVIKENGKKIHFLGMVDGPNEIDLVKDYIDAGYINSWDSSSATWHALNGIEYDHSPSGLVNGKFEKEVDFNTDFDPGKIASVIRNIDVINRKIL